MKDRVDEMAKSVLQSFLGQNLKAVFAQRSPTPSGDRYSGLDLVFEECRVRVTCTSDTDELVVVRSSDPQFGMLVHEPSHRFGAKVQFAWLAANDRGYTDLLVLALGTAMPAIAVLAIAGELALLNLGEMGRTDQPA